MNRARLKAFRELRWEKRQLREQLSSLESRMYTPKAQRFTSMPHSASGEGKTLEDLVMAHMRLTDKYNESLLRIEQEQFAIEEALQALQPRERMLIRYRYIDCLSWDEVCRKMHYEWAQTHRIHDRALRALEDAERKEENERH